MAKAKFSPAYDRLRLLLVKARESAGLRQEDVAKRLKRPQSYVSKIELGERRLDVVEYIQFTRAIQADAVGILRKVIKREAEDDGQHRRYPEVPTDESLHRPDLRARPLGTLLVEFVGGLVVPRQEPGDIAGLEQLGVESVFIVHL